MPNSIRRLGWCLPHRLRRAFGAAVLVLALLTPAPSVAGSEISRTGVTSVFSAITTETKIFTANVGALIENFFSLFDRRLEEPSETRGTPQRSDESSPTSTVPAARDQAVTSTPSPPSSLRLSDIEAELRRLRRDVAALETQEPIAPGVLAIDASGISPATLDRRLSVLEDDLRSEIANVSSRGGHAVSVRAPSPSQSFQDRIDALQRMVSLTNDIDQLGSVTIKNSTVEGTLSGLTDAHVPDGITVANYVPLVGDVSISGALTITDTATSTFAGGLRADVLAAERYLDTPYFNATSTATSSSIAYRLGVATTSPSDTLAVDGAAFLARITAPGDTTDRLYNDSGDLYWAGNLVGGSTVGTWTSDGTDVWRASGSVGIGTTSPAESLATANRLYVGGSGTSTVENNLHVRGTLQVGAGSAFLSETALNASNSFTIDTSGTNNHLALQTLGRVGIASSSPWGVLSVEHNGANASMPAFVVSDEGTSTPSLLVDHMGFVGIGSTTPGARFSVAGSGLFDNLLTASTFRATSTTATSTIAGGLAIETSGFVYDYSSNRVGIGTTSPYAKLSVVGPTVAEYFHATSTTATSTFAGGLAFTGNYGLFQNTTDSTSAFQILDADGGAPIFHIDSTNERVGVGTASPNLRLGQKLEVATGANFGGLALSSWTGAAAQAAVLDFNRSRSPTIGTHTLVASGDVLGHVSFRGSDGSAFQNAAIIEAYVDETPGVSDMPGRLIFKTTPDGSTSLLERMRINNAGNVNIGGSPPVSRGYNGYSRFLDISNETNAAVILRGTSSSQEANIVSDGAGFFIDNQGHTTASNNFIVFRTEETNSQFTPTERMRITNTGLVGIGTSTPYASLTLWATSTTQNIFEVASVASSTLFVINQSGSLGIGTTSPSELLSVQGNALISGTTTVHGLIATSTVELTGLVTSGTGNSVCLSANNTLTASGAADCAASSQRYKKDIEELEIDSGAIYDLAPVSFTWREGRWSAGERDFGLIAEEVEELLPELVTHNAEGVPESVRYSLLSVLNLAELQNLNVRLEELEAKASTTLGRGLDGFLAAIGGRIEDGVLSLGALVADAFTAREVYVRESLVVEGETRLKGRTTLEDELCLGSTCVTEAELKALLALKSGAKVGEGDQTPPAADAAAPPKENSGDTEPPTITLRGNNPARVPQGSAWKDPGADVKDDTHNDLGYRIVVDGAAYYPHEFSLDTASTTAYMLYYTAVDGSGNRATTTRAVEVFDPATDDVRDVAAEHESDDGEESADVEGDKSKHDEAESSAAADAPEAADGPSGETEVEATETSAESGSETEAQESDAAGGAESEPAPADASVTSESEQASAPEEEEAPTDAAEVD